MLSGSKLFSVPVLLITIWYKTRTAVNDVSSLLQSEAITIDDKLFLIGQLLEDLKRIRGSWSQIFKEAVVVAGPLGFETELVTKRKRKSKRFRDQKKEFEVHILNIGLDSLI